MITHIIHHDAIADESFYYLDVCIECKIEELLDKITAIENFENFIRWASPPLEQIAEDLPINPDEENISTHLVYCSRLRSSPSIQCLFAY